MKEDYLHFLWRMRFLPTRNLVLTNLQEIEIVDFGEYNQNESGPDFVHAKVLLEGIVWFGSIEFHLKSSDWYKHGHQSDPVYNNVILHVVWEDDKNVIVQDRILPTLVLSNYINEDFSLSHKLSNESKSILPCTFSLESLDKIYIEKEKESRLHDRMIRKTKFLKGAENEGYAQILYELLATAFGAKVNKDPFWELSRRLPIKRLLKMNQRKRANAICVASGLQFEKEEAFKQIGQESMTDFQWKRKGLHPKGFPEIRVRQFAHFVEHFNFDFGFLQLSSKELLKYLDLCFNSVEETHVNLGKPIHYNQSFRDLIIMNSFVPFIWWLGEKRGDNRWHSLAYEILQMLPAESNNITKLMMSSGFELRSAYDSQSLLELYNQHCSRKKCLSCTVGNKILDR